MGVWVTHQNFRLGRLHKGANHQRDRRNFFSSKMRIFSKYESKYKPYFHLFHLFSRKKCKKSSISSNCLNPPPIISFPPFVSRFEGPKNETISGVDSICIGAEDCCVIHAPISCLKPEVDIFSVGLLIRSLESR